ncbi:SMI1/KNR4 family protein [Clostridium sp. ZS2-4]|uniref:SMI1/KNR4 family protein n=1 Tax=Clostridium sp. ZS2-4 TaxID=2987703 RepID=UPI00227A3230|nr:SMI1/KNR4 family protein [Clostridium sp. ZS2-4]MCY6354523.1 SMI1/KNR4 family protein [Clostridium sp. ZS2-4]
MYNNRMLDVEKSKITENDLKDIEESYNIVFPDSFRKHYLMYNGGRPEKNIFIDKDGDKQDCGYFYAIKYDNGKSWRLKRKLKIDFDEESIFPKWLVRFAGNFIGMEFCWSLRKEEYGAIYYWDCDVNLGDDPSESDDYAVFLANSLEEFMNLLVEDEEE